MKRVIVATLFIFIFWGESFACEVCQQLSSLGYYPSQIQGLGKIGAEYGSKKEFARLVVNAQLHGKNSVLRKDQNFTWVIDNEGWARQLYRPDHILQGKTLTGKVSGKSVTVFVPDNKEFVAAVVPYSAFASQVAPKIRSAPAGMPQVFKPPAASAPAKEVNPKYAVQTDGGPTTGRTVVIEPVGN